MARDYGRIRSQFWPDEKVQPWSMAEKGFASYLLTSEHATALGAYRLPIAYMCADLGIQAPEARGYVAALVKADFIAYDDKTGWVFIKKYLAHNEPENANVWKHVRRLLVSVPDNLPFKAEIQDAVERHSKGSRNSSQTVSEGKTENPQEPNLTEPIPTEPTQEARARNFEAVWRAYPHPGNTSRSLAQQAFDQLGEELPPIAQLTMAVDLYRGWLNTETKRRPPNDPPPAMHLANWLKERRFDAFITPTAEADKLAADAASRREELPVAWRDAAELFVAEHGWNLWEAAISNVRLVDSDPPGIEFKTGAALNLARDHGVLKKIAKALGCDPSVTIKGGKAA